MSTSVLRIEPLAKYNPHMKMIPLRVRPGMRPSLPAGVKMPISFRCFLAPSTVHHVAREPLGTPRGT